MLPLFFTFPGLNIVLVVALLVPAIVGGAIVFALRRLLGPRVAMSVGCILALAAIGLSGWAGWECQAAIDLPVGETDNDGTIRGLMMVVGYLVWATLALIAAMMLAFRAGRRRPVGYG